MKKYLPTLILTILFFSNSIFVISQQNQQLYLMHYLPESNFLNPAVQAECKWFIGLPVISSIHTNYANSAFSFNNIFSKDSYGTYTGDEDKVDRAVKYLGKRSYINEEFHTTLLALGYRRDYNYFNFSVIEKVNSPLTVSKEAIMLAWKGNSQFEGENASLNGTATYITHYREYALGYSTLDKRGDFVGIKAKLLFGKANFSTPVTDVYLYTDQNTFDLRMKGEIRANVSAPVIITQNGTEITSVEYDENVSASQYLLNRKNWGVAFDLGILQSYSDKLTLSASILDLGFIRWRSNINNINGTGDFIYEGIPADSTNLNGIIDNLLNMYTDSFQYNVTNRHYLGMLPLKIYGGAEYQVNEKMNANLILSGVLYRSKLPVAATFGLDYNPFRNLHIVGSYSLMYRSFTIVGLGLSFGKGPFQFYAITDNLTGFIFPLSTRNINLRFGVNINLGCNIKKPDENARELSIIGDACNVFDKANKENKKKVKRHK